MRGESILHTTLFKIYLAIPFLYELKLSLDFTFTASTLDLFKWLKFESLYDTLYLTNCLMKASVDKQIGKSIDLLDKLTGAFWFIFLIVIFLGPLVLFSGLNPTNILNDVTGAKTNVRYFYIICSSILVLILLKRRRLLQFLIISLSLQVETWIK